MNLVEDMTFVIQEFEYVTSVSTFFDWIGIMPWPIKILLFVGMFGIISVSYMFIKYTMPDSS